MNGLSFQPTYLLLTTTAAVLCCGWSSSAFAQDAETIEAAKVEEAEEEIVVQATRSSRRVQDEPQTVGQANFITMAGLGAPSSKMSSLIWALRHH